MTKTVLMKIIEKEYYQEINKLLETQKKLTVENIIELSGKLYFNIKVKGISLDEDEEADIILFQYGNYNWDDELGEHFSFNITRQFTKANQDMYQLSLTLVFDPVKFKEIESYNSWSSDFQNIEAWIKNIKATKGYEVARSQTIKSYELSFEEI